jgi:sulfide:quinone oxidoreductase
MPAAPATGSMGLMSEHVVIVGGGVGALEGLLALQSLAGDRARITVLTAGRHLTYRALSVAEPFGGDPVPHYDWEAIARRRDVRWIQDRLTAVRPEAREIETRDGPPVPYDALLLALGATPEPALPAAVSFGGPRDVLGVTEAIEGLAPGRRHAIAFVAAAGTAWTLPLYELALLTAERARARGLDLAIELITSEDRPLGVFGTEASAEVGRRLADAGIHLRTGTFVQEVTDVDLVIALPRLRGRPIPGLPHDGDGFVPVDGHCRVPGADRVWAVGDMTARPLKQGGLAAQQADVAAADIAARAGAAVAVPVYHPSLRGLLLTGAEPLYLERTPDAPPASRAASSFLWWPPHKVVGRYMGPYLESLGAPTLPGGRGSV